MIAIPRTDLVFSILFAFTMAGCRAAQRDLAVSKESLTGSNIQCTEYSSDQLSTLGRLFMQKNGLIHPGEELNGENDGPQVQWRALATKLVKGKCLLVMNLSPFVIVDGTPSWDFGQAYEVLGLTKDSHNAWVGAKFEDLFPPPKKMRIAAGPTEMVDYYYGEVSGASAVHAYKALLAGVPACGLDATMSAKGYAPGKALPKKPQPDGKASFDPTPGRNWKLARMDFSLRRGSTPEICDIRPIHFTNDFANYFTGGGGCVQPWGACFLRQVQDDNGRWQTVALDATLSPPTSAMSFTHEVQFRSEADGRKCFEDVKNKTFIKSISAIEFGPPGSPPSGAHVALQSGDARELMELRSLECVAEVIAYDAK